MESWLQQIFGWLPSGWVYYSLIGLISFFESLALVGIFVPGSVLIVFAGFLAAHGKGDYLLLMYVATLGSIIGDLLSYLLGARLGDTLLARPFVQKRRDLLRKSEIFFNAHGGKSVFIGRFAGFLRPFIPFVAGCSRMRPLPFILYALVSGILWGIAYPGLGYFFGASWKLVQVWTGRFSLLVAALALLFLLNALFWKWCVPRLFRVLAWCWAKLGILWQRFLQTPVMTGFAARFPRLWSFLAARFTLQRGSGLYLTVGFGLSILFAVLFIWVLTAIHLDETLWRLDQRVYELAPILHHPAADTFLLLVTYLGSMPVILILGSLALLWLLLSDRDFSAAILAAGTLGGELLVFVLKVLFQRHRPEPYFPHLETISASFPSAHAFQALVFYGLVTYMLLGTVRNWRSRLALILSGSFLALLIGFSRLYLGVHWFSDILGGFALAAVWLTFLIAASEIRRRYGGEFPWRRGLRPLNLAPVLRRMILFLATAAALWGTATYMSRQLPEDRQWENPNRTAKTLPAAVPLEELLAPLPGYTENLWGSPVRPLHLVLFARPEDLRTVMGETGWIPAAPPGLGSFLRWTTSLIQHTPSPGAPALPRLVAGRHQDLTFVRTAAGEDPFARHVVLFWRLNYRLPDGRTAFAGLASFQSGVRRFLGLPLPVPKISPQVDAERDALAAALGKTGRLGRTALWQRFEPGEGVGILGNPYQTDGRVWIGWIE